VAQRLNLPVVPAASTIGTMSTLTTHLYIVRHAWAEDAVDGQTDAARPLTKKGCKRFAKFVERLQAAGMQIDCVATSPLVRARQTAEIMATVLTNSPPVAIIEALAPPANWQHLVEWTIEQDAKRVAWVGHMPCVGRLVALTIGDGSSAVRMQKGAVASICLDDGPGHPGELEWLATADIAKC
jgi:phosphohistidine phosphatase